jgi:hypothetical protein
MQSQGDCRCDSSAAEAEDTSCPICIYEEVLGPWISDTSFFGGECNKVGQLQSSTDIRRIASHVLHMQTLGKSGHFHIVKI